MYRQKTGQTRYDKRHFVVKDIKQFYAIKALVTYALQFCAINQLPLMSRLIISGLTREDSTACSKGCFRGTSGMFRLHPFCVRTCSASRLLYDTARHAAVSPVKRNLTLTGGQ